MPVNTALQEQSSVDSANLARRREAASTESKMKLMDYSSWRWAVCSISTGLFLSLIAFVVVFKLEFLPTNVILYEHKTMYNDWQT